MNIIKKQLDSINVFEICGRMDVTGSQKVHDVIVPAIPDGGKIIINMSRCDYVASSGLRILLVIAKQSAIQGCKTVLVGVQPMVWDVIMMTGFEDVLESYSTQEDALSAIGMEKQS